jgi:hypothetical protein
VKICLPDCTSEQQCDEGFNCIKGACWPIEEDIIDIRIDSSLEVVSDATVTDTGTSDPMPSDASVTDSATVVTDASGVDASISAQREDVGITFSEPIILPDPETRISGTFDPSFLVGIWQEQFVEPEPESTGLRLVIEETSDGRLIGTMTDVCDGQSCDSTQPPPEAVDPDMGYPPSAEPDDFWWLSDLYSNFSYRIFDGRVEGRHLSFWISMNELWHDWCALQTSYRIQIDERVDYSCLEEPIFIDVDDFTPSDFSAKELLCSANSSVCKCDKDSCTANYRDAVRSFDMVIDGDVMQVFEVESTYRTDDFFMHRQ